MGYLLFQLAVTLLAAAVLLATMRLWRTPRARYFILLCLAVFLYAAGYLFELGATGLGAAYTAMRVQYLGVPFIGPLFYLFIRDYTRRSVTGWRLALFFIVPSLAVALANGWPAVTLYFRELAFAAAPTPHLLIGEGPLYWVDFAYSHGLMAAALVEVLVYFPRRNAREKRQVAMFLLAGLLPVPANLLLITEVGVPMDFGAAAFALAALILLYYILNHRLQDWLPYARERVMERMKDGFVLVDRQGCYLDSNRIAGEFFPALNSLAAGTPLAEVEGFPLEMLEGERELADYTIQREGRELVMRVSVNHITTEGGVKYTCLMLYDATELHRLMSELEELATHDGLTGLLNRNTFFRFAGRDFDLSRREGVSVSVLMLDIDFFKNINDRYGHQRGDEVLRRVAAILAERLRRTDICGRYGGEEFCVFLPGAGAEAATLVAEMIRRAVAAHPFESEQGAFHITVSVGLAQLAPEEHSHLEELIKDADEALYAAKRGGRNRVEVFARDPARAAAKTEVLAGEKPEPKLARQA